MLTISEQNRLAESEIVLEFVESDSTESMDESEDAEELNDLPSLNENAVGVLDLSDEPGSNGSRKSE